MAGVVRAALALLAAAALGLGSGLPGALQDNFRNGRHVKMMVPRPEVSAADAAGVTVRAPQMTPSRTEAAKEEETLKSLVDALQQVMRNAPRQSTPARHSALAPAPNDAIDALLLKVHRKHDKKEKTLENVAMTSKPTPSATPSALKLQTDPDIPVFLCVYKSTQLTIALDELVLMLQTAATKKKTKTLNQLINGFSDILEGCFGKRGVKYYN